MLSNNSSKAKILPYFALSLVLMLMFAMVQVHTTARAQDAGENSGSGDSSSEDAESDEDGSDEPAAVPAMPRPTKLGGMKILGLLAQAGLFFMVPIAIVSIGVVTFSIERTIALRRGRILPDALVANLGRLGGKQGGFDPRQAYKLCQQYPSSASTVIRAMLLKVGRPHSEVEHAVQETSEREANRLYGNVRWLSLAAAVAPLWGLLGTVWGMIMAFYDTAQLSAGQNKAEALAEGIYTALVTTLCGLFIAIPSAIMAHYFEGRITALFSEVDELLFNLLPQVERYEGRVRFNRSLGAEGEEEGDPGSSGIMGKRQAAPTPP